MGYARCRPDSRAINRRLKLCRLRKDRRTQLAIERVLEIIGEAAGRISDSLRKAHPEIPWRQIIGQRNVLIHEYGEIKQDRLWKVAKENIPQLIEMLKPLV
jgi:uncharacterized protein with HEPN domain